MHVEITNDKNDHPIIMGIVTGFTVVETAPCTLSSEQLLECWLTLMRGLEKIDPTHTACDLLDFWCPGNCV